MELFEECEKYKKRGFDEKGALAKAVAHYYFPGTPGIWREFIQLEKLKGSPVFPENIRAWDRQEAIHLLSYSISNADARELVACARKVIVKHVHDNVQLSTGWYTVTLTQRGQLSINSSNKSLPCVQEITGKWQGNITEVRGGSEGEGVLEGSVAFTYTPREDARYHPIVIAIYQCARAALIFLEVRLSTRGKAILQKLWLI